ncbi:NYN domain-containing protein [Povalibacter sp.]|uniref:LabA-like NYN domain-containing protein n=1 Tax=Povalibacter sp. TaxID=1962978 RepID=UPI002F40AEF7
MKRVAIFADVQNIYYTTRQAFNAHFDYNAFWRQVSADREVVTATAFAIDRGDEKQKQFQNILRGIGFDVKLKPFISRADGSSKGDWDVGITLDVLDAVGIADVVVLASGDGDFDVLVHRLRDRHGIEVEIYGVAQLTAHSLKRAATRFVPIDDSLLLQGKQV